jgi:hypothetical protein
MGYDLHITRRKSWLDEGSDITKEEFASLVCADPEFTYPSQMGDDYAEWKSPKTEYETWLCWIDGRLQTKNPEPEFIDKMVIVAQKLGAKVQGDDEEVYLSSTQIQKEEAQPSVQPITAVSWPLWKQLVFAFLIGCVLLTVKLLLSK